MRYLSKQWVPWSRPSFDSEDRLAKAPDEYVPKHVVTSKDGAFWCSSCKASVESPGAHVTKFQPVMSGATPSHKAGQVARPSGTGMAGRYIPSRATHEEVR